MHLWLLLALPFAAQADHSLKGRVYYPSDSAQPSYLFEARVEEKGDEIHNVSLYKALDGKVLVEEIADLKAGKLVSYSYKQKQVDDYGDATFANDVISMKFTEEGKPSTDTENYDPATVVAPMIQPLLSRRWDEIGRAHV